MDEKIAEIIRRLEALYGRQSRYSERPAMEQLILTMLSHRTTYADERRAFDNLRERFGEDWQAVAAAPVEEVEAAIAPANYPEVKAPRIQETIRRIVAERGRPELDFLAEWPVEKARDWLTRLPGVGPKTSSFLLLFTFRKPVLPVDTHVYRVSQRTGLIGPKVSQAKAHALLLDQLPREADELLNFHKLLFKHGQQICTWHFPKCGKCPLRDLCDYYQRIRK